MTGFLDNPPRARIKLRAEFEDTIFGPQQRREGTLVFGGRCGSNKRDRPDTVFARCCDTRLMAAQPRDLGWTIAYESKRCHDASRDDATVKEPVSNHVDEDCAVDDGMMDLSMVVSSVHHRYRELRLCYRSANPTVFPASSTYFFVPRGTKNEVARFGVSLVS